MAGCFVGRVGGLAAALGVGVLLSLGAPTAWADDDSADRSPGSPSSASSQQQGQPEKPDRKRPSPTEKSNRSTPDSAASVSDAGDRHPDPDPETDSERSSPRDEADDGDAVKRTSSYKRGVQSRDSANSTPSHAEAEDSPNLRSAQTGEHEVGTAVEVPRDPVEPSSLTTVPAMAAPSPVTEPAGVQETGKPEPLAVVAMAPQVVPQGLTGQGFGDGVATPVAWVVAAAARRELRNVDVDTTAVPVTTGQLILSSTTSSLPLDSDGSRALLTTVDGDWSTGFTTRAEVVDTTTGAPIGQPVTLEGAQSGSPMLSADGSHVVVAAVGYDSGNSPVTSVVVINTISGAQTGSTFVVAGDATGSGLQLLNADGTVVVIPSAVYDSRTSTFATWLTVNNFTADEQVGATVVVPGAPYGPVLVTRDGTRAVVTTFVDNRETRSTSTRVAVIDTGSGAQIGRTLTLSGQPSGSTLSGVDHRTARITTTTGLAATVNTETGSASIRRVAFPWGVDLSAFLNTPLGQVVGGVVVSVYFVGSAFLVFYVVYPVLSFYDWVATAVGLPPIRF